MTDTSMAIRGLGRFPVETTELEDSELTGQTVVDGGLNLGTPPTITIASGVATLPNPVATVILAAEASTSDTLDSIVAEWATQGQFLLILPDTGDTITVDDANISLGAATRAVAPGGSITLYFNGTAWQEYQFLTASDNS